MQFGDWLKKERTKRGLTGAALAKRSGVSQSYISSLESGKRRDPSLSIAARITKGLGVPLWEAVKEIYS